MKLFALDMDGTTLSSKNDISPENRQAIKKAQSLGHKVMVLSGRAPESIKGVLDRYDMELPMGGSNGTAVMADGKLLELTSLADSQGEIIAKEIEKETVPFKLYTNKGIYFHEEWTSRLDRVLESGTVPPEHFEDENFEKMCRIPEESEGRFHDIDSLLQDEELSIQKFFILVLDPVQKERMLTAMKSIEGVYVATSSPFNIEIMNINGNKGNGLKVMADYFNIPLEETVAIGDQNNDIPMFEAAGFAIAMGNALDEVKRLSDYVTLTNDENGVAHAIEYVLNSPELMKEKDPVL
ncbi:Cof-type HAD-IIB family hydrolase [Metabacillus sp. GX 13764]|uniref:Cof-type HAD-IIB family hydrolase n=1 Tax=Metabacillus kandeliae TaxID=2900151 RepID=UPI001E282A39|nr:Cof-type HAD-IIB family hydrolase [Metabacillus kandeliae]MCD7035356.1 Cof-type HAD-IIB family hydrolase [Metabacillus kandeliae]